MEDQKRRILYYGREMSDLIIGSHKAASGFILKFTEWKSSRLELISLFEHLQKNLKESSKKYTNYRDMLNIAKNGALFATDVPIPHVSIAARIVSILTGLFSIFLNTTEKKNVEADETNFITIAANRDTNTSADLYMYGLQCGQQFEETTKLIEEFYSNIEDPAVFQNDSPELATFLHGISEYQPRHRTFYKKLQKCFKELLSTCTSDLGRIFCEPILLYSPEAVDVIGLLDWRFRHEDFNCESVRFELEQIENLFNVNDISIKELTVRVQRCIGVLQDEVEFLEGCVKDIALLGQNYEMGAFSCYNL